MFRIAMIAAVIFMLGGCAGTVGFMVPESDKDPAFSFDGAYTLEVDHPGGRQEMSSGWFSKCQAEKITAGFTIKDSKISWPVNNSVAEGFVNKNGEFRLEKLLDGEVKGTTTLSDGSVTLILQGDVSENTMKGLLVYGVAQFTNRGCSYPVSYSKN